MEASPPSTLDSELDNRLLSFSSYIRGNYKNLDKRKVITFEKLLAEEIKKLQKI